jgi:hypothetical protein
VTLGPKRKRGNNTTHLTTSFRPKRKTKQKKPSFHWGERVWKASSLITEWNIVPFFLVCDNCNGFFIHIISRSIRNEEYWTKIWLLPFWHFCFVAWSHYDPFHLGKNPKKMCLNKTPNLVMFIIGWVSHSNSITSRPRYQHIIQWSNFAWIPKFLIMWRISCRENFITCLWRKLN